MSNLLVKLEDFQLDEISGGITAKQVRANMVKHVCALSGSAVCVVSIGFCIHFLTKWLTGLELTKYFFDDKAFKELDQKDKELAAQIDIFYLFAVFGSISIGGAYGWKLGEWICKKIGLED